MHAKFDYKKVAGSGWLDLFYDLILAGLCWFMSESLSLDGFEKSKSCVLRSETSTQPQTGSRLAGWRGGSLGIQGLEKKESTRNQKTKI